MPRTLYLFFLLALPLSLLVSCKKGIPYQAHKTAQGDNGMVVTPHPLSSQVGLDVLREGGNAVDATVAVHFAMAVVFPRAGNLGGGGFMVFRQADGSTAALDYRERAPLAADRNMYLDSLGNVDSDLSTKGHLASGVPGTPAGLLEAHARYGSLDLERLIDPAIRLAEEGYPLSPTEADRINRYMEDISTYSTRPSAFVNQEWKAGDHLVQPELAETLRRIRDEGHQGFYAGETARLIVEEMQRGGGLISREDLSRYEPAWRDPVIDTYRDYRVISMPPSSSGGIALLQMLGMVEPYPLGAWGQGSAHAVHLMVEAERRAYADRAKHVGDSDFYDVPRDSMLSESYLAMRMESFDPAQATASDNILAGNMELQMESFETTHTSIVDADGNAVSSTTTLNSNFGSKVVVGGAGFFLNNEMDDFSAKPGVPNQFGLVGAEANAIEPMKRMLSSMTPTIVEHNGQLEMVLGAPGGSTIITAVFQVILNVLEFDMTLEEAVNAGRFHHQWLPDRILTEEDAFSAAVHDSLVAMGHSIDTVNRMAVIKAIHVLGNGRLQGVGDPRNPDDDARGF